MYSDGRSQTVANRPEADSRSCPFFSVLSLEIAPAYCGQITFRKFLAARTLALYRIERCAHITARINAQFCMLSAYTTLLTVNSLSQDCIFLNKKIKIFIHLHTEKANE